MAVVIGASVIAAGCSSQESNADDKAQHETHDRAEARSTEVGHASRFPDGTYHATVDYNNPATGYSATYDLDVDVQNGEVVEIHFPSGGYLDEDHISPAELDEDGDAEVQGEDGKTYSVHIEPPSAADDSEGSDDSDSEQ